MTSSTRFALRHNRAPAKIKNAELVTGDPEFKQVQTDVKIAWLRSKSRA